AESDLLSELDGAINFLNTGKPYFIAGIGTLTKKMNGSFEFHKEKFHPTEREKKKPAPITEKNSVPQTYIDETRKPRKTKPAAIITILCLLAIGATVWFYLKNAEKNTGIEEVTPQTETAMAASDTVASPAPAIAVPASYKYVLEIARQPRATKRFSQLKTLRWPVEIET